MRLGKCVPKYGSRRAVKADGRKARPAPRAVQLKVASTKMGIVWDGERDEEPVADWEPAVDAL